MDPATLLDWLIKVGPYALFLYAELRRREERDERLKSQQSLADYLKDDIGAKDRIARSIRTVPGLVVAAMRLGPIALPEPGDDA